MFMAFLCWMAADRVIKHQLVTALSYEELLAALKAVHECAALMGVRVVQGPVPV